MNAFKNTGGSVLLVDGVDCNFAPWKEFMKDEASMLEDQYVIDALSFLYDDKDYRPRQQTKLVIQIIAQPSNQLEPLSATVIDHLRNHWKIP